MIDELCIDFVNSLYKIHSTGRYEDRLPWPAWREAFAERHGLDLEPEPEPPLEHLAREREQLRRMLESWASGGRLEPRDLDRLDGLVAAAPGRRTIRAVAGTPAVRFEPARRDWTWVLAEVAASATALMAAAEPARLKVCGNPDCTWLFYDQSHNSSRRWCDVRACGNLVRVREYRARQRASGG